MTRSSDTDVTARRTDGVPAEPHLVPPQPVDLRDSVRWGPVWAGALTVLATFLVLQLLFFALGWLDLAVTPPNAVIQTVVSGVLALLAFLVGGLTAAAVKGGPSGMADRLLTGVLVWALTVTIFLVGGLIGAGALVGPLGQFTAQGGTVQATAGWVALGFGLALLAACLGTAFGTRGKAGSTRSAGPAG